jgi:hypothetical protein
MRRQWVTGAAWVLLGGWCAWGSPAWGATPVQMYRSVGPGPAASLANGGTNGNHLTITSTNAVFSQNLPNTVGIGDIIQYDSSSSGSENALAVITARTDAQHYSVIAPDGVSAPPAVTVAGTWDIFRAYTSLSNAAAGTVNALITVPGLDPSGRNLVSLNQVWNLASYGDTTDTAAVDIPATWVTDATHYLRIYAPYLSSEVAVSQRHAGVWNYSAYRLVVSTADNIILNANDVTLEGLQVMTASSDNAINIWATAANHRITQCLIVGGDQSGGSWNLGLEEESGHGAGIVYAWNNIFYDFIGSNGACLETANSSVTTYFYSNTIYHCDTGIKGGSPIVMMDTLCQGTVGGASYINFIASTSDYNIADKGSAPGSHSTTNAGVQFVSTSAKNFHLAAADTVARGTGADLSADPVLPFTIDIDGQTRTSPWDVGADQVPGGVPTSTPTRLPTRTSTPTPPSNAMGTPTPTPTLSIGATPPPGATFAPPAGSDVVAYPQPAVGNQANFYYLLDAPAQVHFDIFNVTGEKVASWDEDHAVAGYTRSPWAIRSVAPGIYLFRLRIRTSQGERITPWKKIVIVKK